MTQVHAINFFECLDERTCFVFHHSSTKFNHTRRYKSVFQHFPTTGVWWFFLPNLNSRIFFNGCCFFHHLQRFCLCYLVVNNGSFQPFFLRHVSPGTRNALRNNFLSTWFLDFGNWNEQWKTGPKLFRVNLGDEILPSYQGTIINKTY